MNKIFLTRQEQSLLGYVSDRSVVDLRIIEAINRNEKITTNKNLRVVISNLVRKGRILRLKRGLYYISKTPGSADAFSIGALLFDGYIGLESALFFYGASSAVESRIYVVTPKKRFVRRQMGRNTYLGVPFGRLCYGSREINGQRISTKAKTLFDCIYRIGLIGDITALFRLIRLMTREDFEEFIRSAENLGTTSFYEKSGYVIETARGPEWVWKRLASKVGKRVITRLGSREGAHFVPKWNLYDGMNLEKRFGGR